MAGIGIRALPQIGLVQRQAQQLAITPQLRQAIQLLQMANLEIETALRDAVESNPFLAQAAPGPEPGAAEGGGADREAPLDVDGAGRLTAEAAETNEAAEPAAPAFDYRETPAGGGGRFEDADGLPGLDQTVAAEIGLREHLARQIALAVAAPEDRLIAFALLDRLDEAGYVRVDLAGVAAQLGCAASDVERVLARLHTLEPVGIFARDLAECLAIQLKDKDRYDPAMRALVANLETLARGEMARLQRLCGVDAEDLKDMIAELRALDPRPAAGFEGAAAVPVVPDVLMRAAPDGKSWIVEMNAATLPRLIVDREYAERVRRDRLPRSARAYVSEQLQAAKWLVRALDQRTRTILAVAAEIVRRQDDMFRRGIAHMRPLVLRDIAQAIEAHESTVSRAIANKFVATPRGTFELKYFFSAAIAATDGGEAHAAESVRRRIKALIDAEIDVLSDDQIVSVLRREGYDLARRTVAKYRELLAIPSSVERRRQRAIGIR